MEVIVEIKLTADGWLVGRPLVSSESRPATSEYSQAYQKSALRAIAECQPYSLPHEYYDEWKHFEPAFLESPFPSTGKGKPVDQLLDTRRP